MLDFNNITTIPSEIKTLENLEEFSVAANQLSAIPVELGSLSKLSDLNILNYFIII